MKHRYSIIPLLLVLGCEPKSEVTAPKDSSAEAKALTDAYFDAVAMIKAASSNSLFFKSPVRFVWDTRRVCMEVGNG